MITLSSPSTMTQWPEVDAADWQARAYLQAKSTGQKVLPTRVEIRRGIQTRDGPSIAFYFPKTFPNGAPLIGPRETGVEFYTQVGPRIFHATFVPAQMVAKDGVDL